MAWLTPGCADAWSPKVLRAGMGAHFAIRVYESVDLEAFVQSYPGMVFATTREAALPVFAADLRGSRG